MNADPETFERRRRLAELIFEEYGMTLPSGTPLGPKETWPEGWVELMADTPPIIDLDAKIAYGASVMNLNAKSAWQGFTS